MQSAARRRVRLSIAIGSAIAAMPVLPAFGVTSLWNGGTDASWSTGANWTVAEPTATEDALFPNPVPGIAGSTITLSAAEAALSLTLRNAYTLNGGDLTLGAGGKITVAPTFTATIGSTLAGANGLTLAETNGLAGGDLQAGGGVLLLNNGAANSFTGPVAIQAGTVRFSNINQLNLGNAGNTITLGTTTATGTLDYTGNTVTMARTIALSNLTTGGGAVNVATAGQTLTLSGVISGGPANPTASGTLGSTALTLSGPGRVALTGTNTFTGNIVVDQATLVFTNVNAQLGGTAAGQYKSIILQNGGTFNQTTGTFNPTTGATNTNNKRFVIGTGGGTFDVASGATVQLDDTNQISGTGTITKISPGVLLLNNQAYGLTQAMNVTDGTLRIGTGANGPGILGVSANPITVSGTGAFDVQLTQTNSRPINIAGSGIAGAGALVNNGANSVTLPGNVTMTASTAVGGSGTLTLSGVVSDGGGGFSFTKVGTGLLVLSNSGNTWGGNTTVSGGVLRGAAGSTVSDDGNLNLNGGAFESTVNYAANLGAGNGEVRLPGGASGFSSGAAGGVTVNLSSGVKLDWGTANFNPSSLVLNQASALGTLTLQNPIDLMGAPRSFTGNAPNASPAIVSEPITSTGGATGVTINGGAGGSGVIRFTNANNSGINAVTLTGGELGIAADGNIGGAATPITFNGGGLQIVGTALADFGSHPVTFNPSVNIGLDINEATHTFTVPASLPLTTGHSLTKVGPGKLVLSAATNTVTALNMHGGTLEIGTGNLILSNLGATTFSGTGDSVINATGGGTITLSTAGGTNYGDNAVSPGVTATINAKITSVAGSGSGFEFCCTAGGGTFVLNNTANDFEGDILFSRDGTIAAPVFGNQDSITSSLGQGERIRFNNTTNTNGPVLKYLGTGEQTNRIIALTSTLANNTSILDQSGTGELEFTTNLEVTGAAARTLILQGSTAGEGKISGIIPDSSTVTNRTAVLKRGTGTWTLSGANTYTGATTIQEGTLKLGANNAVSTTGALTLGAGGASGANSTAGNFDLNGFDQTITSLTSLSSDNADVNTVTITTGKTLAITGNVVLGQQLVGVMNNNVFTGGGTLNLTGTTLSVGLQTSATANQTPASVTTLNLTGLGQFTTNITNFDVGNAQELGGQVSLSNTANDIAATTLTVGHSQGNNGGTTSILTLGTGTNLIKADTIQAGLSKIGGTIRFASQAPLSPGSVTITNKAGNGPANITLGSTTGTGTAANFTGLLDLRGHEATVTAGALSLGTGTNTAAGSVTGTLNFDDGNFTVNTVTAGSKTGATGSGAATGNINISGGSFTVNAGGSFLMAGNASATAGSAGVGLLNITGGTVTSNVSITRIGGTNTTATVTLDGGALDMVGQNIGGGTAATTINNVNLRSGTLSNVGQINNGGSIIKSAAVAVPANNTLTLGGTNSFTGAVAVNSGTLLVNGTHNTAGNYTVAAGATVGGTGTVNFAGANTLTATGTAGNNAVIAPGASIGTLTIGAGSVVFGNNSAFLVETGGPGVSDLLAISTGTIDLTSTSNTLALLSAGGGPFTIATFTGYAAGANVFEAVTVNGSPATFGPVGSGSDVEIAYNPTDITITVVPEPASLGLLGVAAAALLARRRRR